MKAPGGAEPRRAPGAPEGLAFAIASILGICFWFSIGFPFANHNESYDWVVWLETHGFRAALAGDMPAVNGIRPLATGLAWLLYRGGGHSLAWVQLLNCGFTLAAWLTLSGAIAERRLFALLALLTGGVFFSGYLYLFHLHGLFYGPLLLLLAVELRCWRAGITVPALVALFIAALALAPLHPFALPFYAALAVAAPLERAELRRAAVVASIAVSCALALVAIRLLVPPYRISPLSQGPPALIASFRTVEVHPLVSAAAIAVAAFTAARAWAGRGGRIAAVATALAGIALLRAGLPVLPLWVAASLAKAVRRGWWAPAALVGMTFLLPFANPTGSPTYTVFVLMMCAALTSIGEAGLEARLGVIGGGLATALIAAAAVLAVALRLGISVPGASALARPLLAERERTVQLETLVDRVLRSPWRDRPIRLYRAANPPVGAENAVDRIHRPPTQDLFLQDYVRHRRGHDASPGDTLWVTFGGDRVPGAVAVLAVRGRFAGEAAVYRRPPAARARL